MGPAGRFYIMVSAALQWFLNKAVLNLMGEEISFKTLLPTSGFFDGFQRSTSKEQAVWLWSFLGTSVMMNKEDAQGHACVDEGSTAACSYCEYMGRGITWTCHSTAWKPQAHKAIVPGVLWQCLEISSEEFAAHPFWRSAQAPLHSCLRGSGGGMYRGICTSLCNCLGFKSIFPAGCIWPWLFICLLASSAEMKSYQLLSSINQMGSFPKTLGSCFPFKPAAVMGFCWLVDYCLCCAGSLVSGGRAYGKESGAISMSLKVFLALAVCWQQGLFPLIFCASLHSMGLFPVLTYRVALQPSHPSLLFLVLTTGSSLSINSFLLMFTPLKNNLMKEVSLL